MDYPRLTWRCGRYPRFTALWAAGIPGVHNNASTLLVIAVTPACVVAEDATQLSGRIPRPLSTASQLVVYAA